MDSKNKKVCLTDCHIHSGLLKHTKNSPKEFIAEAINNNYKTIVFVEHFSYIFAISKFKKWSLNYDTLVIKNAQKQNRETKTLKEYKTIMTEIKSKYDLNILIGLEVDFYSDHLNKIKSILKKCKFDLILGSCHYIKNPKTQQYIHISSIEFEQLLNEQGEQYVYEEYFKTLELAIDTKSVDYIAHLDYLKKKIKNYKYSKVKIYIEKIIDKLIEKNVGLEVNIKGVFDVGESYPSKSIIKKYIKKGGKKLIFGSDSHSIKDFRDSKKIMLEYIKLFS